mgnify:CR=1 FL=1
MQSFCITYDLKRKSSKHYQQLLNYIRNNYEVIKHQKSVLIVISKLSSAEIRTTLLPFIDEKDKLEVFSVNLGDAEKLIA